MLTLKLHSMNIKNSIVAAGFILLGVIGCKEDKLSPVGNDGVAPEAISNVSVENLPGGAKISYSLPGDSDLLYVEADYKRSGMPQKTKSSIYGNYLIVEGLGDTLAHDVTLYAVDRGENRSQPVNITINPKEPPVQTSYDSLAYSETFGGIHVTFPNRTKANLVVTVLVKDSTGDWEDYDKYYTGLPEGDFSVRGLPSVPTTFGVFVKDRWDNHSDTLVQTLTPLFEMELDKTKFKEVGLPTDQPSSHGWTMPGLWNNSITGKGFHTAEGSGFPQWFTFSIGDKKAKLSRMKVWQRQDSWIFTHGNPKHFQVWGSNAPSANGSFDGWTLLMDCWIVKPSGLPPGDNTNDDVIAAAAGEEFEFPADAPAVRYIRFKIIESFVSPPNSSAGFFHLMEVTFWGQQQ